MTVFIIIHVFALAEQILCDMQPSLSQLVQFINLIILYIST